MMRFVLLLLFLLIPGGAGDACKDMIRHRREPCVCDEFETSMDGWIDILCCCAGSSVVHVPRNLSVNVTVLDIRKSAIDHIDASSFDNYSHLHTIRINDDKKMTSIDAAAFANLRWLKKLWIENCPKLTNITGTLMENNPKLLSLLITRTGITEVPRLRMNYTQLPKPLMTDVVDLSHNKITIIKSASVANVSLASFVVEHNHLEMIEPNAFDNASISLLKLNDNLRLESMSEYAFFGVALINTLDVSRTSLRRLPEYGLRQLQVLVAKQTPTLKTLPPVFAFTRLQKADLTYPYHCCFFKYVKIEPKSLSGGYENNLKEMRQKYCQSTSAATITHTEAQQMRVTPQASFSAPEVALHRRRRNPWAESFDEGGRWPEGSQDEDEDYWGWGKFMPDPTDLGQHYDEPIVDNGKFHPTPVPPEILNKPQVSSAVCDDADFTGVVAYYHNITCAPLPDALNPCEDVMGYVALRMLIWLVWFLALTGNILVIVVLVVTKNPRTRIHNFLMLNLAIADLLMGIYLAMLAVKDVETAGEYYNYAVDWQTGLGCKVAGFLTVFAGELSIWTMMLISFDVWYNTKYCFYGKHLEYHVMFLLMMGGWVISILIACLPFFGISSYSSTSTCLPVGVETAMDQAFLIGVLLLNLAGFVVICVCYISIYFMVAGSTAPTAQAQDILIAKRMAILIVTDFLCWAPTIFFGLTAAANRPLINISVAKVFLVMFYPINSCANPFLYVFFTKTFRRDMYQVLRKTEIWRRWREKRQNARNANHQNIHRSRRSTQSTSFLRPSDQTLASQLLRLQDNNLQIHLSASQTEPLVMKEQLPEARNQLTVPTSTNRLFRLPVKRQYQPNMSDIIETSNSNSQEEAGDPLLHKPNAGPANVIPQLLVTQEDDDSASRSSGSEGRGGYNCMRRGSDDTTCSTSWGSRSAVSVTDVSIISSDFSSQQQLDVQAELGNELHPQFTTKFWDKYHKNRRASADQASEISYESGYGTAAANTPDAVNIDRLFPFKVHLATDQDNLHNARIRSSSACMSRDLDAESSV